MTRTLATLAASLLVPTLLLSACGGDDEDGNDGGESISGRVTTADGAISLKLPDGWENADAQLDGPVVFAANQVGDENQQVIISSFPKRGEAEDAAIFAATGVVQQGATCKRVEKDRTFGAAHVVIDCAFTEPEPFHKVFVIQLEKPGRRSALVLAQGDGETLADLAGLVNPVLDSWRWL